MVLPKIKNMSKQRQLKVLDIPKTYILVDSDLPDSEIIEKWLSKHNGLTIGVEQRRREKVNIRGGKVYHRKLVN